MDIVAGRPPGRVFALVLQYLAFAGVGAFQLVFPSGSVQASTGWLFVIWAVMIISGGMLASVGVVARLWLAEFAAQPLVAFPFAIWGQAVASGGSPARWAFVSLCFAIIVGCAIRAVDIWWLARYLRGDR